MIFRNDTIVNKGKDGKLMGRLKEEITVTLEFHNVDGGFWTHNNPMIENVPRKGILLVVSRKGRLDRFLPIGGLKGLGVQRLEGVEI